MIPITSDNIQIWGGGGSAITNGRQLATKRALSRLNVDGAQTLIWGLCAGSGSTPYSVSVDFSEDPHKPVFRCSCPSKQIPCKHVVGLLFSWLDHQVAFGVADVPEDIVAKRDKREESVRKKADKETSVTATPPKPRKANNAAQTKKITAQLEGLDLLEKMLRQVVDMGLSMVSTETLGQLEEQSKQLAAYYLPGAQNGLHELIDLLQNDAQKKPEGMYRVLDRVLWLQHLSRHGSHYLKQRLDNRDLPPATDSPLEEWLGKVWQLQELRDLQLVREQIDLLQLSFGIFYDRGKREHVDLGLWVVPGEPQIWETRNYRPLKASAYIKEEDSENRLLHLTSAFLYPGDLNRRLRWETYTPREADTATFQNIVAGSTGLKSALRTVKKQTMHPLRDKAPCVLVRAKHIALSPLGPVLRDYEGDEIVLADLPPYLSAPSTELVTLLSEERRTDLAVLIKCAAFPANGRFIAQPLALVSAVHGLTRLL